MERLVVGARNNDAIWKASKPRRWQAHSPPPHLLKEPSCLSLNSGSFYSKRGESKVKHFLVPISLQRECVNFFLPAVIHR